MGERELRSSLAVWVINPIHQLDRVKLVEEAGAQLGTVLA